MRSTSRRQIKFSPTPHASHPRRNEPPYGAANLQTPSVNGRGLFLLGRARRPGSSTTGLAVSTAAAVLGAGGRRKLPDRGRYRAGRCPPAGSRVVFVGQFSGVSAANPMHHLAVGGDRSINGGYGLLTCFDLADPVRRQIRSHSRFAITPTLASIAAAASRQTSSR